MLYLISLNVMTLFHNDLFFDFLDKFFVNDDLYRLRLLAVAVFLDGDSLLPNFFNDSRDFLGLENDFLFVNVMDLWLLEDVGDFLLNYFIDGFLMNHRNVLGHFDDFGNLLV